jgi:DEAD/DEAH box helicase domain-containing protein
MAARGQAGRGERLGGVLVASGAPLDQFIIEHPGFLRTVARMPASTLTISKSAGASNARRSSCRWRIAKIHHDGRLLPLSRRSGLFTSRRRAWHWTSQTYPADAISLRGDQR